MCGGSEVYFGTVEDKVRMFWACFSEGMSIMLPRKVKAPWGREREGEREGEREEERWREKGREGESERERK